MIVLKPEEMKEVDNRAIAAGFPDIILMETAGRAVAEKARSFLSKAGNRVLILAGKGNNGGDGLVAARFLDMWGYNVKILLLAPGDELTGSPSVNYKLCQYREIEINYINDSIEEDKIKREMEYADLIIDAMLGTGLKGEVREPILSLIKWINMCNTKVLAVDIPSGLDGERGSILGSAVRADFTVTMAYPKVGLVVYPGKELTGQLEVVDLGVPERFAEEVKPTHFILTYNEVKELLPLRETTGHKGTFGKVVIFGGSKGMAGAPSLTGKAALKTGAGLVRVAVPAGIQEIVANYSVEIITEGLDDDNGNISTSSLPVIEDLIEKSDVIALGPGMGRSKSITEIVRKIIVNSGSRPVIIDADGINSISNLNYLKDRKGPTILTPHPGEMARLIKEKVEYIERNRINIAREFSIKYQTYLVLKGAATVIALPDGKVYINQTGNNGLATAGSGDVLTGIISGLIAQGVDVEKAVVLGPYLHGFSADLAVKDYTTYGLNAGDIIRYIPESFKKIREGR